MKRLKEIDLLVARLFREPWTNLHAADALARPDLRFPGVYLLACTGAAIDGARVKPRDVFYVGMSNAGSGVRGRLRQFMVGIETGAMHSGAVRFFREYGRERAFSKAKDGKRFYFAALTLPCVSDKAAASAADLRTMGHVACLEYYAIAHVTARTGRKPVLNKLGAVDAAESGTGGTGRR
jgi:hypothetical protein